MLSCCFSAVTKKSQRSARFLYITQFYYLYVLSQSIYPHQTGPLAESHKIIGTSTNNIWVTDMQANCATRSCEMAKKTIFYLKYFVVELEDYKGTDGKDGPWVIKKAGPGVQGQSSGCWARCGVSDYPLPVFSGSDYGRQCRDGHLLPLGETANQFTYQLHIVMPKGCWSLQHSINFQSRNVNRVEHFKPETSKCLQFSL